MENSGARKAFAAQLDAARRSRRLTIRDIGRIADVPTPTAQGWLNGKHFPVPALRPNYLRVVEELGLTDQLPAELWQEGLADLQPRLRTSAAPYLGLRPFGTADRERFFGRASETRRLADVVRERLDTAGSGVVVVLGASGSGKSSLLSAGLIATETVDGVLAGVPVLQLAPAELAASGPATGLVVIDQFEEALAESTDARSQAMDGLDRLATTAVVVIGLRADAFAAATEQPALADALTRPFLIAPLTHEEARQVILGPARLAGLSVDDELVTALLDDLTPGPVAGTVAVDSLPLLSNALLVTWAAGTGARLTLSDYVRAGGVSSAVQGLAEDVFGTLDPAQQDAARRLFVRLVRDSGGVLVRETVPLDDIDLPGRQAMDAFVTARMLTVSDDAVRISHEALLSHWTRLRDWMAESRADLEVIGQLRRAARVWQDSGRSADALIPVDRLEVFSEWFADPERQQLLSPRETQFIAASREHFTSVLAAEHEQILRLRRGRTIAIGLTALASALALVAGLLYWQGRGLEAAANASRLDAQSRQVALEARSLRADDPNLMAQMALTSADLADTRQASSALLDATSVNVPLRWLGAANSVIAKSPDQHILARANGAGEVTLWRGDELITTPGTTFSVDPTGGPLYAVALTAVGGRTLMAVGGGSSAGLWDVTDEPKQISDLRDGDFTTYGVAFTRAGDRLAVATSLGEVRLWTIPDTGVPVRSGAVSLGAKTPAKSVAFTPAGQLFVAGSAGSLARWQVGDAVTKLPALGFSAATAAVVGQTVEVSPDGTQVAVGLAGRQVLRWRLSGRTATALSPLTGFASWVNDLAYSADGRTLVVGNSDQSAYLFDAASGALTETLSASSGITGTELVGDRPVTSSTDGVLRVWQAGNTVLRTGASNYVLASDANGRFLADSTQGEGIVLWDTSADWPRLLPAPDPGAASTSSGVGVAPNGNFLVAGTVDGSVLSWPLTSAGAGTVRKVGAFPGSYISYTSVAPDSSLVAAVQYNGNRILLFRADSSGALSPVSTITSNLPQAASFSPDGALLAVPTVDNAVELWNVRDPAHPSLAGKVADVGALPTYAAFANRSALLAIGTDAGRVSVWDVSDPAVPVQRHSYGDPHAAVYATVFSPDDQTLAAGNGDGLVWAWHLDRPDSTAYLALDGGLGRVSDVRFLSGGARLVAAGDNGTVRLWTADLASAHAELCANRGDVLTPDEWTRYLPGVTAHDPC